MLALWGASAAKAVTANAPRRTSETSARRRVFMGRILGPGGRSNPRRSSPRSVFAVLDRGSPVLFHVCRYLLVVVDLDVLVDEVPRPQGVGEFVDHRSLAATGAGAAARRGTGDGAGDRGDRPTAGRAGGEAGAFALHGAVGGGGHVDRRPVDDRAGGVRQRVVFVAIDLRQQARRAHVDDVRGQGSAAAPEGFERGLGGIARYDQVALVGDLGAGGKCEGLRRVLLLELPAGDIQIAGGVADGHAARRGGADVVIAGGVRRAGGDRVRSRGGARARPVELEGAGAEGRRAPGAAVDLHFGGLDSRRVRGRAGDRRVGAGDGGAGGRCGDGDRGGRRVAATAGAVGDPHRCGPQVVAVRLNGVNVIIESSRAQSFSERKRGGAGDAAVGRGGDAAADLPTPDFQLRDSLAIRVVGRGPQSGSTGSAEDVSHDVGAVAGGEDELGV